MQAKIPEIKTILQNLDNRTKQLNCLYKVDELLTKEESPLEEMLIKLASVIKSGFRYDELCEVAISLNEQRFVTEKFRNNEVKVTVKIKNENHVIGDIQVVYVRKVIPDKGIFLAEEHQLLKTIGEKLSHHLTFKKLKETLEKKGEKVGDDIHPENITNWLKEIHLTDEEIKEVLKVKIHFKKGETMCKQGAITSYIMFLADGLSKNYLEGNQERGFNFSIVKPFDFIGLSSLYGKNIYHFSGSAITPCTIYLIEIDIFKKLIQQNFQFSTSIFQWFCRITQGHLKRLSCIGNKQALGRIAEILIYLTENVFQYGIIPQSITRKDIAELAAMSTESAVRILSDLKKDHIIQISSKGIEILDSKLLQTLSMAG